MNPNIKNKESDTSEKAPIFDPRDIIPIMTQSASDPLGSYTGTAADESKIPTQDADDL